MKLAEIDLTSHQQFAEPVPHEWFTRLRGEASL